MSNALEIKHQLYVRQWAAELEEFRQSGMTIKNWCQVKNIPQSTFSMHRRAVLNAVCTSAEDATGNSITELIKTGTPDMPVPCASSTINLAQVHLNSRTAGDGIHISRGQIVIDIGSGVSLDQLRTVLEVMLNAE